MRRTIIAGNWKMHKTCEEALTLIDALLPAAAARPDVEVLVAPPFTALYVAGKALAGSSIGLAAQNVFWKNAGAYTGNIAPPMLAELGVSHVIVGHSETRGRFGVAEPDFDDVILRHFGESDSTVNRKLLATLAAGMTPICCVGETIAERKSGDTDAIVASQTAAAVRGVAAEQAASVVFAYEPVWAIGTGEVCDSEEANRVCGLIRATIGGLYTDAVADQVRVQYGGSVKPDNAAELLAQEHIDGALVGGASLKATDFSAIIAAAPKH